MAKKDKTKAKKPEPPQRKKPEEKGDEGLPLWMMTYSDLVTLLLTFFILLLSFAKHDVNKFRTVMGSIQNAFGIQVRRPEADFAAFSPSPYERKDMQLTQDKQEILGLVLQLKNLIQEDDDLKETSKITADSKGVIMRVDNNQLFEVGSARIKDKAKDVASRVIDILKEQNLNLVVRGHTDDTFTPNRIFPSNWELSSARAAALLRLIVDQGDIKPTRLKAVGYADSQPLVPNNSDKNRAVNRRTEFYFHQPEVQTW